MDHNIKGNRTLLLVDDEEKIVSSLARLFRKEGYTILRADSGKQGLSFLKKHSINVILSDQKMPEMTGVEFLSKAKSLYPDTIRIILSGYTDLESILDAINKGEIFRFVTKPWDNDLLVKIIAEAFKQYELKQENKRLTEELKSSNFSLEEANKILRHNDVLTCLPNRMYLSERLSESIKLSMINNGHFALLVIDIDRFKNINESLGHNVGDELLKHIAARLNLLVRKSIFVARLGGDEFGIILNDIANELDISTLAEEVITELSKRYVIEENELYATASIGISIYPYDGDSNISLLKNADSAMYRAKEKGKNNFQYYSHEMSNKAKSIVSLETNMRRAIENKEFVLYFQPQIELGSYKIRSVEALIRWQDPDKGLIPPNNFIPFLEETDMIIDVGKWVITEAMKRQREFMLQDNGPKMVSINVSGRQFTSKKLTQDILDAINYSGLAVENIEIEITESLLMDDIDETIKILSSLKEIGIQIAVDDFGTGYSSLSYLKRLPIDILKLDMSFVKDIAVDSDSLAIASAIISLGHELGMEIIAEGVESESQLRILGEKNCDIIQGFYFSKAIPVDEMESFVTQHEMKWNMENLTRHKLC